MSRFRLPSGAAIKLHRLAAALLGTAILAAACSGDSGPPVQPLTTAPADSSNQSAGQSANPDSSTAPTATDPATTETTGASDVAIPPLDVFVFVEPAVVRQGGVFLVAVDAPEASAASVVFRGEFVSLLREGDRFFTILPVDARTEPGPLSFVVAVADADGRLAFQQDLEITVEDAAFGVEVVEIDEANERLLDPEVVAEDIDLRTRIQRTRTPERLWSGVFLEPAIGPVTSEFGVGRSYNFAEPIDFHTGLDVAADRGKVVVAPNDGLVAWTGRTERRGLGVIVDHGGAVFTAFWHLDAITVEVGAPVLRGAPLGRVGNTGLSTGPHLHWEIIVHGTPTDPRPWLLEADVPDPAAILEPANAVNAPTGFGDDPGDESSTAEAGPEGAASG